MAGINPDAEAVAEFAERAGDGPVVLLYLFKYQPHGGAESYAAYAAMIAPLIAQHGGRILYTGRCEQLLAGEEEWDMAALVEYPTFRAWMEMVESEPYQAVAGHREVAFARTLLYATTPSPVPTSHL
jgi:uncharacterized protein (DUF1330 family)